MRTGGIFGSEELENERSDFRDKARQSVPEPESRPFLDMAAEIADSRVESPPKDPPTIDARRIILASGFTVILIKRARAAPPDRKADAGQHQRQVGS